MNDLKTLLDTIDRLRAQHRAGITPAFGDLDDLFDYALRVRVELVANAAGVTPPVPAARPVQPLTLERVTCAPIRMTVEFGQAARVVMEGLPIASNG